MTTVGIVSTGLCNIDSIARAVEECDATPVVTSERGNLGQASHIVLPGVGAFPAAMSRLRRAGLDEELTEQVVGRGVPFLGICLGMQLLATRGHEVEETAGLGWIDGETTALQAGPGERIPHIGWNEVERAAESPLFVGIEPQKDFYFVHSFVLRPTRSEDIAGTTAFGGGFVSSVHRDNVYGVQFHPEKSQRAGFAVLRNFLGL
jgi:glutamine amidotransferase